MNADRAVRWTAVAAVLAVAGAAGYFSYWHCVDVVTAHAEPGVIGHLYPVTIDGIIVGASMVLLDAAGHDHDAPALAWWLLGSGIAATLAANVAYGVQGGWESALWAAWPAFAFVGCYELLMLLVRASSSRAGAANQRAHAAAPAPTLGAAPADAQDAALMAFRATLAAGNELSGRQLETRFGLSRAEATKVRQLVLAEANGHAPKELDARSLP